MKPQETIGSLLASIRAALYAQQHQQAGEGVPASNRQTHPFVTVSRQAGAGGRTFAKLLVERLNAVDAGERPWAVWDRELVERVAAEHHIPEAVVERLGCGRRSPLEQLAASLGIGAEAAAMDEYQIYRRVAQTIRGLALAGKAVIVGRGGAYATDDLPGGVHVRLVAPSDQRVRHMAQRLHRSDAETAAKVRELDEQRAALHRRFWHAKATSREVFTITLNTAAMDEDRLIDCVLPLIRQKGAGQPGSGGNARASVGGDAGGCRTCRAGRAVTTTAGTA